MPSQAGNRAGRKQVGLFSSSRVHSNTRWVFGENQPFRHCHWFCVVLAATGVKKSPSPPSLPGSLVLSQVVPVLAYSASFSSKEFSGATLCVSYPWCWFVRIWARSRTTHTSAPNLSVLLVYDECANVQFSISCYCYNSLRLIPHQLYLELTRSLPAPIILCYFCFN